MAVLSLGISPLESYYTEKIANFVVFSKDLIDRKRFRESQNLTLQNFLKMTSFPRISEIVSPPILLCSPDIKLQNELNTFSRTRNFK